MCSIVQDYSPESSKSPEVTFAVDTALAFESNNFIKFFKLVKCVTHVCVVLAMTTHMYLCSDGSNQHDYAHVYTMQVQTLTCLFLLPHRSATFLNSCLLHRYFFVVRVRGLRILNRAHSMQKRLTPFPLQDLTRMLAFTDEAEVCRPLPLLLFTLHKLTRAYSSNKLTHLLIHVLNRSLTYPLTHSHMLIRLPTYPPQGCIQKIELFSN